ncbi:MAG: hypothetical protein HYY65_13545 [Candidatus Tectomicrobia bacterium]|uniref:histidine kinase n=1 Tax=Tectimicrobiota bacterium TaxID=2528274 RepID=A0A932GRZ9_UNCTE|nr:hypothetical protein [Candidatus Tectomicrobia bacterium]
MNGFFKDRRTSRYFLASLAVLLLAIAGIGLLAAVKQRDNLTRVLMEEGSSLAAVLQVGGRNAVAANRALENLIAQRLLDNARLIDELAGNGRISEGDLLEIARENRLQKIEILNERGEPEELRPGRGPFAWGEMMRRLGPGSPDPERRRGPFGRMMEQIPREMREEMRQHMRQHFYSPLLEGKAKEALQGFGERQFWQGRQFGVAVRRKSAPGAIVITANADYILSFREEVGLQKLMDDLRSDPRLRYVSLQDANFKVVTSSDRSRLGQEEKNPFLEGILKSGREASRVLDSPEGRKTLEVAAPFLVEGAPLGLFRIGLSMDHVEAAWQNALRSLFLYGAAVLLVAAFAVGTIFSEQQAQMRRARVLEKEAEERHRLASLGNLAAGVAHEVRNPLNAIGMGLQRLQREFRPGSAQDGAEYQEILRVIRDEVNRLNGIIENFLTLARPMNLQKEPVSLSTVVSELETLLREEIRAKGLHWETRLEPNLPAVAADPRQLKQALMNLILNGIQATPPEGSLELLATPNDRGILLSVRDSGAGISPEDRERIFDPYFTTKQGGTGLGLTLARQIIEAHAGRISVESSPGQGSTFTLWLPTGDE